MNARKRRTVQRAAGLALALGCAGAAGCAASNGPGRGFDINFADNRPADIAAIAAAVAQAPGATLTPLVVLTPPPPARGLVAFALPSGQRLWQSSTRIDARPRVLGDVVVSHGDGAVLGWDAQSGRERFRVGDRGYGLIGAARDGDALALTLGPGELNRREGVFLVLDATSGGGRFERHVEQALGTPAVAGDYAFVPWNGQYLTIVDARSGEERARIRSVDDVYSRAVHEGGAVYFGARSLYRLSAEAGRGEREGAATYAMPRADLPGNPVMLGDGYAIAPAGVNARERVAVALRPDPARAGVRPVDDTLYALFHRAVFALAAEGGAVRWGYVHGADIVGSQPVRGGLVVVDDQGTAALIDAAHGNVVWRQALGTTAAQASLQLPLDFAPPRSSEEPAQPAVTTLIAAAGGTDNRLLPARIFAARALAAMPDAEATRGLLEVAGRRNYPAELRAAAGEALARRTDGMDALLEALNTHYDFVRGTTAPPVGYIARAIAATHDRRGAGPLIAHLQDNETPVTELPPLVSALRDLADPAAVPALLDFLRLYHADQGLVPPVSGGDPVDDRSLPEQEALSSAMELAAQAVAQLGGPRERRWLAHLRDDPSTLQTVRVALEQATAEGGADGGSAGGGGASGGSGGGGSGNGGGSVASNLPPERVTSEMIQYAFASVRERMMACLRGATSRPSQVRLQFRYDNTGALSGVTVTPGQYQACIAAIASEVHLPESQATREIGTFYLLGGVP